MVAPLPIESVLRPFSSQSTPRSTWGMEMLLYDENEDVLPRIRLLSFCSSSVLIVESVWFFCVLAIERNKMRKTAPAMMTNIQLNWTSITPRRRIGPSMRKFFLRRCVIGVGLWLKFTDIDCPASSGEQDIEFVVFRIHAGVVAYGIVCDDVFGEDASSIE